MLNPDFVLIYVTDPQQSRVFYAALFGCEPVEESPTFALFVLTSGLKFGMWARDKVEPAVTAPAGGSELLFTVTDAESVQAMHRDWTARKLPIVQEPTQMDFGYTFVALDPDGHRLRVFAPSEEPGQ